MNSSKFRGVKTFSLSKCAVIAGVLLFIAVNVCGVQSIRAQEIVESQYFSLQKVITSDGRHLEKSTINGPPEPPEGFLRPVESVSQADIVPHTLNLVSDIPAFTWCFGCSATSAAMIAGYYDRHGYPDMYTGPTNGGVMPLNNDAYWSTWVDAGGDTRNRCPLSATQNGLDGRVIRGHVDDYWIEYGNTGPDPFVTNGWTEHSHGDCTADFMGTNQASAPMENSDGGTTFWNYANGQKLTAQALYDAGPSYSGDSGLCGLKEFYESRGYTVVEAYNQYIYPYADNIQGFTYQQYKDEIDAGRPVLFHVEGHTMVGRGYDDTSGNLMYIHDTWDHSQHSMTWGGTYAGMQHYAVTIVKLEETETPPAAPTLNAPTGTIDQAFPEYNWDTVADADTYRLVIKNRFKRNLFSRGYDAAVVDNGDGTCSVIPGLALDPGDYYWLIIPANEYGQGDASALMPFTVDTTQVPPAAPALNTPTGTTDQALPEYNWDTVTDADSYKLVIKNHYQQVLFSRGYDATAVNNCDGTSSVTPGMALAPGDYYWLIIPGNEYGQGDASALMPFTVDTTQVPPAAPTLNAPAGTIAQQLPAYNWDTVADADTYRLVIKNRYKRNVFSRGYDAAAVDNGDGTCSITPGKRLTEGDYYWLIIPANEYGQGDASALMPFTVDLP